MMIVITMSILFLLLVILIIYSAGILPLPFYAIRNRDSVQEFVNVSIDEQSSRPRKALSLFIAIVSSLKHRNPAIRLQEKYLHSFVRIFAEPVRPIINRRNVNYYTLPETIIRSSHTTNREVIIFQSRIALLILPIRRVLDHLLSRLLIIFTLLVYAFGIAVFLAAAKVISLINRERLRQELTSSEFKVQWFDEYVEYLNRKCAPWEIGFLIFKALEGFHFRTTISRFGVSHPNCEFGVETAVISTLHLHNVDYIDVGCEVISGTDILGDIKYVRYVNCYLENNPFEDNMFQQIYLVHIVDHIPDLPKAFRELNRILCDGGRVFFSGLSHSFSGYYLEEFCGQGNYYNTKNLEWYENLCKENGFRVLYESYIQSGVAGILFKFTNFFHYRTEAWNLFARLYNRSERVQALYRWVIRHLLRDLYLLDEFFVDKNDSGLNFMIVMEKEKHNQVR